ncbi:MAG: hypothetical protein VB021_05540 [Oscillospiraceae bacterium]|nr:hypothetical protein [Oscillospiraceae bacterium]
MKRSLFALLVITCLLLSGCAAAASDTGSPATDPAAADAAADETAFFEQTKTYILSGQKDLPAAQQLLWNPSFLDALDFAPLYADYTAAGGAREDAAAFAAYLTQNAPVPDNWKALFEADLRKTYDVAPEKYEDLGGGSYQVYVEIDGAVVPYVTVNARTGWYQS